jgi:hypothetical protein
MADTKETKTSKKGRESYSHAKADARKAKRREEAEIRQSDHDSLTVSEKIAKAKKRGGSVRELLRLTVVASRKPGIKVETEPVVEPKLVTKKVPKVSSFRKQQAKN